MGAVQLSPGDTSGDARVLTFQLSAAVLEVLLLLQTKTTQLNKNNQMYIFYVLVFSSLLNYAVSVLDSNSLLFTASGLYSWLH